jgi:hypothetical protein
MALGALASWLFSATPAEQVAASRIVLASVTNAEGRPVVDLEADDFAIAEGDVAREVLSIYVADYPIVVLLDNGADAKGDLDAIRNAAGHLISRLGQRAVAVGTLANPPAILATFDEERAAVLAKLEAVSASTATGLAPVEAVSNAARLIREVDTPFAAVIIVSGGPIHSEQQESPDRLRNIFESGVSVHVVSRRAAGTAPRGKGDPARPEGDLLQELSDQTHGQYTPVYTAASYSIAVERLADRLATEMMIEYLVPNGLPATGDVRIGVKVPGARVRGLGVSK